ncbi:unnamed protein product, partial [Brassica oleracea var. botrytis]
SLGQGLFQSSRIESYQERRDCSVPRLRRNPRICRCHSTCAYCRSPTTQRRSRHCRTGPPWLTTTAKATQILRRQDRRLKLRQGKPQPALPNMLLFLGTRRHLILNAM